MNSSRKRQLMETTQYRFNHLSIKLMKMSTSDEKERLVRPQFHWKASKRNGHSQDIFQNITKLTEARKR